MKVNEECCGSLVECYTEVFKAWRMKRQRMEDPMSAFS